MSAQSKAEEFVDESWFLDTIEGSFSQLTWSTHLVGYLTRPFHGKERIGREPVRIETRQPQAVRVCRFERLELSVCYEC